MLPRAARRGLFGGRGRVTSLVAAGLLATLNGASGADRSTRGWRLAFDGDAVQSATRPALSLERSRGVDLPPPPQDVVDLPLADVFKPVGRGGLEYRDRARALEGRLVRMVGFMVRQERRTPGTFLLAPVPTRLAESHYALADDLPAVTVYVSVRPMRFTQIPYAREPLVLVGRLSLGNQEEPSGRISSVRLAVDEHLEIIRSRSREFLRPAGGSSPSPVHQSRQPGAEISDPSPAMARARRASTP